MRTLRSRLREHQHMGVRKAGKAHLRGQPTLRQPNTRKTGTEMEERYYSLEDLEQFKVEVEEIIDPDLLQEEREQHKLHLHQANRQRLPKTPTKDKAWSWNRIRSRPNTKHGYH